MADATTSDKVNPDGAGVHEQCPSATPSLEDAAAWLNDVPPPLHPSETSSGRRPRHLRIADSLPSGSTVRHRSGAVAQARPSQRDDADERLATGDGRRSGDSSTEESRDFFSVRVYGSKAALCWSLDTVRRAQPGTGNTVRIEAAASRDQRQYDWDNKIALQLTLKELPIVLAVLMRWIPSAAFKAHGPRQDKGIALEGQAKGRTFVKVWESGRVVAVPVSATDLYDVVCLVLRQLSKNAPQMDTSGILAVVRELAGVYAQANLGTDDASS